MKRCLNVLFLTFISGFWINAAQADDATKELINDFGLRESKQPARNMPGWQTPKKIVIQADEKNFPELRSTYPDTQFIFSTDQQKLKQEIINANAFIGFCNDELLEQGRQLHWMQSFYVGVEKCVKPLTSLQKEIVITNTKGLSGPEIAEHAIALMLMLVRGLDAYSIAQQDSRWDKTLLPGNDAIWELEGRTLLVVGLGGIGKQVAKRGQALGMKVIATRNSRREGPGYVSYVGLAHELNELARQADVVINTVPLTSKTRKMFNADFFKDMQNHAYFISVGRGASTDTEALLAALKAGELGGAGLDVTDPEPLPADHELWDQPRVVITPHVAARSEKVIERIWLLVKENLRRYIAGEKILLEVNLNKGY